MVDFRYPLRRVVPNMVRMEVTPEIIEDSPASAHHQSSPPSSPCQAVSYYKPPPLVGLGESAPSPSVLAPAAYLPPAAAVASGYASPPVAPPRSVTPVSGASPGGHLPGAAPAAELCPYPAPSPAAYEPAPADRTPTYGFPPAHPTGSPAGIKSEFPDTDPGYALYSPTQPPVMMSAHGAGHGVTSADCEPPSALSTSACQSPPADGSAGYAGVSKHERPEFAPSATDLAPRHLGLFAMPCPAYPPCPPAKLLGYSPCPGAVPPGYPPSPAVPPAEHQPVPDGKSVWYSPLPVHAAQTLLPAPFTATCHWGAPLASPPVSQAGACDVAFCSPASR
ncbi:leucine-rich repeat extensin-like protein 5 [Pollicipes pollicipes]|uniref:leucine-rich repeat extensin-like protein 5 n=1 Tax=Pollicipes pollicipes TaxID=41117 RepID=UPI00188591C5|nr:leucine-rich repeat extensin-like protein 5 [Pollicipes pollicipes]